MRFGILVAIIGVVGIFVGAALTGLIQFGFWKRQHAIEKTYWEIQDRRSRQIAIAETISKLTAELVTIVAMDLNAPHTDRIRVEQSLIAVFASVRRFFSDQAAKNFQALEGQLARRPWGSRRPIDELIEGVSEAARILRDGLYDEALAGGTAMPEQSEPVHNPERRLEVALAARSFEIGLFWQRALFFWGFIAAAFIAYVAALGKGQKLLILISGFGMVCSVSWTLANRGSKYWQENWEQKVEAAEEAVTGPLFKREEPRQAKGIWLSGRRFSVSKLTIAVSDYVSLVWMALFVSQTFPVVLAIDRHHKVDWGLAILCVLPIIYLALLPWHGRSSERRNF